MGRIVGITYPVKESSPPPPAAPSEKNSPPETGTAKTSGRKKAGDKP